MRANRLQNALKHLSEVIHEAEAALELDAMKHSSNYKKLHKWGVLGIRAALRSAKSASNIVDRSQTNNII